MPVDYRIDKAVGIVHTEASGELTDDEAFEYQRRLWADPNFIPAYREFFDFSGVKPFLITSQGLQMFASKCPFGEDAQRAFVAHDDHVFGMLRVLQVGLEQRGQNVGVFRTESEAWRWLEQAKE